MGLIGLLLALLLVGLLTAAFLKGGVLFADPEEKNPVERIDHSKAEACAANRGILVRQMAASVAMGGDGADMAAAYGDQAERLKARDEVNERVGQWTGSMDRDKLMAVCLEFEVPIGPINTIADIFDDPQFQARDDLITMTLPDLGDVVVPGVLPKLSETPGRIASLGPGLGEHNEEILGGLLGIPADDLEKLRREGVI